MNFLFITWDGPQVTYLRSLFLPIFAQLQKENVAKFRGLQFTRSAAEAHVNTQQACDECDIPYSVERVCGDLGPQVPF